eukprot:403367450
MNEAKIFLHFALSEKNEDERLQKLIKACKIIADIMPNDSINESVKTSIPEILPKLVKMLPYLTSSIDMLLKAFIERFAIDTESISQFYKIFMEEFQSATHTVVKEKSIDYLFKVLKRLDKSMLISVQNSLETVLKSNYFLQDENRDKAVEIAEYLEEWLDEDQINTFIYQEFLGYVNTVDHVLQGNNQLGDRRRTLRANSIISESGFGDSFISDFQTEAADMNLNFDDFKSALKTESKIDRIEAFMNTEDIYISSNKNIRNFLNKKDNLEVFVSLISRPHEVESRIWWKQTQRISLEDKQIFEDYREFNLKNQNNYYLYDNKSLNKIDYINKNAELKNIYRSFNALQIFLAKDNLEIILERFEGSFEKIILTLKDGLDIKNNANIEHVLMLMRALISERPAESLNQIIGEKKYILLVVSLLENKYAYQLINQLLFRPQTLMIDRDAYDCFIVEKLIDCRFYEILIELTTLSNTKLEQAIFEFILDKEKKLQQEKEQREKEQRAQEEEEMMIKSRDNAQNSSQTNNNSQVQSPGFFMFSQILQQPGTQDSKGKGDKNNRVEEISITQGDITKDIRIQGDERQNGQQAKIPFSTAVKAFQIINELVINNIEIIQEHNCLDYNKYQSELLVEYLFSKEIQPSLLQTIFTMIMKIQGMTDGYTKTYSWHLSEPTKRGSKINQRRNSLDALEISQSLWGVSKIVVAEYGNEISSLLKFILKTYQQSDHLRYLIKGELLRQIKLNFVEFQKYFLSAFREQPSQKILSRIAPMKYQTYEVQAPFSLRKIQMIDMLLEFVNFDMTFLLYLTKDSWSLIVDHFFQNEFCPMYHQLFFKLLLKVFELRDENLLITAVICQNALSKLHALYEDSNKAIEYRMPFKKHDQLTIVCLWVELMEFHFERNENFPGFSSQLESSYSWKRIKQLKSVVRINAEGGFIGVLERHYPTFPYLSRDSLRGSLADGHETLLIDEMQSQNGGSILMEGTTLMHLPRGQQSKVANLNGDYVYASKNTGGMLSPKSVKSTTKTQKQTSFGGATANLDIIESPISKNFQQIQNANKLDNSNSRMGIKSSAVSTRGGNNVNFSQNPSGNIPPNQANQIRANVKTSGQSQRNTGSQVATGGSIQSNKSTSQRNGTAGGQMASSKGFGSTTVGILKNKK